MPLHQSITHSFIQIPPQFCVCLEEHRTCSPRSNLTNSTETSIKHALLAALVNNAPCAELKLRDIRIIPDTIRCLTINQLVRHGVRQFDDFYERFKNVQAAMELEDMDLQAEITLSKVKFPQIKDGKIRIRTLVRLEKSLTSMEVLVDPIVVEGFTGNQCDGKSSDVILVRHLCEKCDSKK